MPKLMFGLSKFMALMGGAVLVAIIALTCLSVIGRSLNTIGHSLSVDALQYFGPVNGDYELVEAGIAFAIFAFLPWCQLNRGHASVEVFTGLLPVSGNRVLSFIWEFVFTLVLILLAWRLAVGMSDKMRYGETTFLLQMPVWWAYAACAAAAVIACIVAVYSLWLHAYEMLTGRELVHIERSAGH